MKTRMKTCRYCVLIAMTDSRGRTDLTGRKRANLHVILQTMGGSSNTCPYNPKLALNPAKRVTFGASFQYQQGRPDQCRHVDSWTTVKSVPGQDLQD